MDSQETLAFARQLMREVWEPYDAGAVPRFHSRDVVRHHREQVLSYDDVVHRLVTDHTRYADSVHDIRDIVADEDKFAIRFVFTASAGGAGQFYHLKEGRIAAFRLLSDTDFDYKAAD